MCVCIFFSWQIQSLCLSIKSILSINLCFVHHVSSLSDDYGNVPCNTVHLIKVVCLTTNRVFTPKQKYPGLFYGFDPLLFNSGLHEVCPDRSGSGMTVHHVPILTNQKTDGVETGPFLQST